MKNKIVSFTWVIIMMTVLSPSVAVCTGTLQKNIAASEAEESKIKKDLDEENKRLESLRSDMVSKTDILRKQESKLLDIDDRMELIRTAIKEKQDKLGKDKDSMSTLLMALQRLARVPPEALIAKPDTPINTARSSVLVRNAVPALKKEADRLTASIKSLEKLRDELAEEMKNRKETLTAVKTEQDSLKVLLEKRKTFYNSLIGEKEKQEEETARLRVKAKDISGLISALKKESPAVNKNDGKSDESFSFMKLFGSEKDMVLPVSGKIKTRFGDKDEHGLTSKGLTIRTTPGATVVSPLAGKVRFAGPFKNYRLIVIVEHKAGYHSLIAGMSEIYAVAGSEIYAGEPVGKISSSDNAETSLYFELRRNGTPTNPESKLHKG